MVTIANTCVIPAVIAIRTTCACHKANCGHIRAVNRRRAAREASFDLSYGGTIA